MKMIFVAVLSVVCAVAVVALAQETRVTPDPTMTPGTVASTDRDDVCSHDGGTYSQRHRLSQNPETKHQVLQRYGVAWSERGNYEDDHDVPLCLGGSDAVENRWPQPRSGTWNSGQKDKLEALACRSVCGDGAGPQVTLKLSVAQSWFMAPADWRTAYCAHFQDPACADLH